MEKKKLIIAEVGMVIDVALSHVHIKNMNGNKGIVNITVLTGHMKKNIKKEPIPEDLLVGLISCCMAIFPKVAKDHYAISQRQVVEQDHEIHILQRSKVKSARLPVATVVW